MNNEVLDREHQGIFEKMNRVAQLNARLPKKMTLLAAFDDLIMFTAHHFKDEEAHMEEIGFPKVESHRASHRRLTEALERHRQEFVSSVYGRFPSSVFDFFKTWVTSHIMIVDKEYAEFERAKRNERSAALSEKAEKPEPK